MQPIPQSEYSDIIYIRKTPESELTVRRLTFMKCLARNLYRQHHTYLQLLYTFICRIADVRNLILLFISYGNPWERIPTDNPWETTVTGKDGLELQRFINKENYKLFNILQRYPNNYLTPTRHKTLFKKLQKMKHLTTDTITIHKKLPIYLCRHSYGFKSQTFCNNADKSYKVTIIHYKIVIRKPNGRITERYFPTYTEAILAFKKWIFRGLLIEKHYFTTWMWGEYSYDAIDNITNPIHWSLRKFSKEKFKQVQDVFRKEYPPLLNCFKYPKCKLDGYFTALELIKKLGRFSAEHIWEHTCVSPVFLPSNHDIAKTETGQEIMIRIRMKYE